MGTPTKLSSDAQAGGLAAQAAAAFPRCCCRLPASPILANPSAAGGAGWGALGSPCTLQPGCGARAGAVCGPQPSAPPGCPAAAGAAAASALAAVGRLGSRSCCSSCAATALRCAGRRGFCSLDACACRTRRSCRRSHLLLQRGGPMGTSETRAGVLRLYHSSA